VSSNNNSNNDREREAAIQFNSNMGSMPSDISVYQERDYNANNETMMDDISMQITEAGLPNIASHGGKPTSNNNNNNHGSS
jgi:hypothetical protein